MTIARGRGDRTLMRVKRVGNAPLNVLDRAGEAEGVGFWTAHLDTGAVRRDEVVVAFSESAEHVAMVTATDFLP